MKSVREHRVPVRIRTKGGEIFWLTRTDIFVGHPAVEALMIDIEERILAVRDGATFLRPETEAVGLVIVELLRPVTYEPLPWPMVDALRALSHRAAGVVRSSGRSLGRESSMVRRSRTTSGMWAGFMIRIPGCGGSQPSE
jgi:hypothetical protein